MKNLLNSDYLNKNTTQVVNRYGEYVPAIPEPFYGMISVDCNCAADSMASICTKSIKDITHYSTF